MVKFREYIPQIKNALGKKNLSVLKKHKLFSHAMKMVKKMVFAFKFQEQTFPLEFLKSPLANQVCNIDKKASFEHSFFSLEHFFNFLSISCQSSGLHWIRGYLEVCSKEQVCI